MIQSPLHSDTTERAPLAGSSLNYPPQRLRSPQSGPSLSSPACPSGHSYLLRGGSTRSQGHRICVFAGASTVISDHLLSTLPTQPTSLHPRPPGASLNTSWQSRLLPRSLLYTAPASLHPTDCPAQASILLPLIRVWQVGEGEGPSPLSCKHPGAGPQHPPRT